MKAATLKSWLAARLGHPMYKAAKRSRPNMRYLALAATVAFFAPALPGFAADLTIALPTSPESMDPDYHNTTANNETILHMIEPLTFTSGGEVTPMLATSWKALNDTTWQFDLRHGVKFHDGSEFTADDVVFSINRVPHVKSPASLTYFTQSITSITAVDPYTVKITTRSPDPELPAKLRMNVIAKPGVEKADFELWSLAVSAVNGCGMCIDAHEHELRKAGLSTEAIQAAVRIAATVHAVASVLDGEAAIGKGAQDLAA